MTAFLDTSSLPTRADAEAILEALDLPVIPANPATRGIGSKGLTVLPMWLHLWL